jgi:hypothetical protein
MYRALYLAGAGYLAICGAIVLQARERGAAPVVQPVDVEPRAPGARFGPTEHEWFLAIKSNCNAVEVELAHRMHPPSSTLEGQAFSAACYALAGKIDAARRVIDQLPSESRHRAAGIVFEIAHPVADAGDDRSAGPIMELVVEYWPNHYMALYHAGMAEFALGQPALARKNLLAFLSFYKQNDGWTRNARVTLDRLDAAK